jgi:iron-only hydrogenase group A
MDITIKVNNKEFVAQKGQTILNVLEDNGIRIPTLCHMKNFLPSGACRICVVEDKNGKLIPSCSYPAENGMEIKTHSQKVVESRKMITELLLSNHPDDCLYCVRNGNCQLQDLSVEHNVVERKISGVKNDFHKDLSSPSIVRDPDKCILCGRCVRVCEETIGVSAIDYINRGSQSVIGTTFNGSLNTSSCVNCGQCIMVCPTGALTEHDHIPELQTALSDPNKKVIVQYAPSISVSLAEEFGMQPGTDLNGAMNAALRRIGFDLVFDTTYAADLTIMEEATELVDRIVNKGTLPMFTSCCPGWVKYVEEYYPDFIPNLSSCKSPQQMMGAVINSYVAKNIETKPEDIYSVSIMPCTAKKFEAQREEMTTNGVSDVDAVLTTREFIKLLNLYGIKLTELEPEMTDSPHGIRSSAGKLFGGSGGVMEAAIRTAYHQLTGSELTNFKIPQLRGKDAIKETKLNINGLEIGVAVVNGLGNAKKLIEEIKNGREDIHFIEVMTCPGGCVAGGGQRIGANDCFIEKRQEALYKIDETSSLKYSHKNPEIAELYERFFEKPLSHKSHELLHTHYSKRKVFK